jgi:hypothetical protein
MEKVLCPACDYTTMVVIDREAARFKMPTVNDGCIYLQEQLKAGPIKDWVCPHLIQAIDQLPRPYN